MPLPADPAVRAFLRRSLVVHMATLSPKRRPFVTPLWFVLHRGVLYITTGPETRAGKNTRQHPEVTLLFHGERVRGSDHVLRLRGTATCHPGPPSWPVLLRLAAKYYLSPRALRAELRNVRKWRLRGRYHRQAAEAGEGHVEVLFGECEFLTQP
jgi:hypothetical protein